jgi:hypothetical protein
MIKKVFSIIISFVIGYGFWYLVMWMYTSERFPISWSVINKTIYLLLGIITTTTLDEKFSK